MLLRLFRGTAGHLLEKGFRGRGQKCAEVFRCQVFFRKCALYIRCGIACIVILLHRADDMLFDIRVRQFLHIRKVGHVIGSRQVFFDVGDADLFVLFDFFLMIHLRSLL